MPRSVLLNDVPAVVLCGGRGTRLGERTKRIPKPMVTIGGQPVLWHLVRYYASFGVRRFILCLGYKAEVIRSWAERRALEFLADSMRTP